MATTAKSSKRTAPRGRGRPPLITTEKLLEVARDVFLERGIRATTADVAERAKISEGAIFHRFKSKDALFRAAMQFDPDEAPLMLESLGARIGEGDLRQTLIDVASRLLKIGRISLPIMMMSWSNPSERPSADASMDAFLKRGEGYRRAFGAVCAFFDGEMRRGRLSPMSPELLSRIFMGALHHYCLSELFLLTDGASNRSADEFIYGLVDVLLRGASIPLEPAASVAHRTKFSRL